MPPQPISLILASLLLTLNQVSAADVEETRFPEEPLVVAASDEAENAIANFAIPDTIKCSLFAGEPMVANPVAFCFDERGRIYVCETFRVNKGVTDNRKHDQNWLDDDLAARTVQQRLAFHKKHLGDGLKAYTRFDDRIRLLQDTDQDGQADTVTVFANRFNRVIDGIGAGILARQGTVFYTCIPSLWRLRDQDGNGVADERTPLHEGYGVHVAFLGHDLHGLIVGPDGKLYFSIGDRGYNVIHENIRWSDPDSGAVFRCELDGSHLEVVATGFRNPQELAFDDYGNLFTGENNSDSGDKARWVYVVEGGDSGWRMAYQYLPDRGPWNREQLWHPYHTGQAAFIVPPVTNFADGPAGLAFYPGTGLPAHFNQRFFLCDFRGSPANSGVRTFRVKPQGAFFEVVDEERSFWNILATDVDFSPNGGLFVSDWVNGWDGEGKGRIYRFEAKEDLPQLNENVGSVLRGESPSLKNTPSELLSHPDRRVRMEAQFALAKIKNGRSPHWQTLETVARKHKSLLARLHAIWGLGQALRQLEEPPLDPIYTLIELLDDFHPEIRAQAAKVIGDLRVQFARENLAIRLTDENLRVRSMAATALGKVGGDETSLQALVQMIAENTDADPIVRHSGIMGLVGIRNRKLLQRLQHHPVPSVRLATVVALRKLQRSEVSVFLDDSDERVVTEAARAIHDVPLRNALPQLAELISRPLQDDALVRRVLNANFRGGDPQNARNIAEFAARQDVSQEMRIEALEMLSLWSLPSNRDRVLGAWRPLAPRDMEIATTALRFSLAGVVAGPDAVRTKATEVAAKLGIREIKPVLHELLADKSHASLVRVNALRSLFILSKRAEIHKLVQTYLTSKDPHLRNIAREQLSKIDPQAAIASLQAAINSAITSERQSAWITLKALPGNAVDTIIEQALHKLLAGEIAPDTRLDLVETAQTRQAPQIRKKLAAYQASRNETATSIFHDSQYGGNVDLGRDIFFQRVQVSCVRCHRAEGRGGRTGPDLMKLSLTWKQLDDPARRLHILESIVAPNKKISLGFETIRIATQDGRLHTGLKTKETAESITIITTDQKLLTLPKYTVEDIAQTKTSTMPADLVKQLSPRDVRDLVEFLVNL